MFDKLHQINRDKHHFTKLPFLESIYDTIQEDYQNINENINEFDNTIEGFGTTDSDFADRELRKAFEEVGFWDPIVEEGKAETKTKKDRWCKDDNASYSITIFSKGPRVLYLIIDIFDYCIKKSCIVFCNLIDPQVKEKEHKIVIEEFYRFINYILVLIITFNLFFMLFYKENDHRMDIPNYDTKWIDDNLFGPKAGRFLFEFSILPLTIISAIFTSRKESISIFHYIYKYLQSPIYQFLSLFFLAYMLFSPPYDSSTSNVDNTFADMIALLGKGQSLNFVTIIIYLSVFRGTFTGIKDLLIYLNLAKEEILSEEELDRITEEQKSWAGFFSSIFTWLVRVGFTYFIYEYISFAVFLYFIVSSFFGIVAYKTGFSGLFNGEISKIINNIIFNLYPNEQSDDPSNVIGAASNCDDIDPEGLASSITVSIVLAFILVILLFNTSFSLFRFFSLENTILRYVLVGITFSFFVILSVIAYNVNKNRSFTETDLNGDTGFIDPYSQYPDANSNNHMDTDSIAQIENNKVFSQIKHDKSCMLYQTKGT